MKTCRAIAQNNKARPIEFGPMDPWQLEQTMASWGQAIPAHLVSVIPLTARHQEVLLSYSHYLGVNAREELLLRLAASKTFHAPLFYELTDRAGREACLRAMGLARRAGNMNALAMLEDKMGFALPDEMGSFWRRAADKVLGLAF